MKSFFALLRKHLHDMNNHLTPLLGYAYLLVNEFEEGTRGKKFAKAIQGAAEPLGSAPCTGICCRTWLR